MSKDRQDPSIVQVHPDHETAYQKLDKLQKEKLSWWADRIRKDPTQGVQIPRRQIPKKLANKYELTNLWRVELPGAYRGLYTILTKQSRQRTVTFMAILDHKQYDRLFGYRTS